MLHPSFEAFSGQIPYNSAARWADPTASAAGYDAAKVRSFSLSSSLFLFLSLSSSLSLFLSLSLPLSLSLSLSRILLVTHLWTHNSFDFGNPEFIILRNFHTLISVSKKNSKNLILNLRFWAFLYPALVITVRRAEMVVDDGNGRRRGGKRGRRKPDCRRGGDGFSDVLPNKFCRLAAEFRRVAADWKCCWGRPGERDREREY